MALGLAILAHAKGGPRYRVQVPTPLPPKNEKISVVPLRESSWAIFGWMLVTSDDFSLDASCHSSTKINSDTELMARNLQ
jgi:hypothetical protein